MVCAFVDALRSRSRQSGRPLPSAPRPAVRNSTSRYALRIRAVLPLFRSRGGRKSVSWLTRLPWPAPQRSNCARVGGIYLRPWQAGALIVCDGPSW